MSFYAWLKKQKKRNDAIGDLAIDAVYDTERPKGSSLKRWRNHLEDLNACDDAITALESAFKEYEATISSKSASGSPPFRKPQPGFATATPL